MSHRATCVVIDCPGCGPCCGDERENMTELWKSKYLDACKELQARDAKFSELEKAYYVVIEQIRETRNEREAALLEAKKWRLSAQELYPAAKELASLRARVNELEKERDMLLRAVADHLTARVERQEELQAARQECEKLEGEARYFKNRAEGGRKHYVELQKKLAASEGREAALRAALQFYADGSGNDEDDAEARERPNHMGWYDHYGKRAREALAAVEPVLREMGVE